MIRFEQLVETVDELTSSKCVLSLSMYDTANAEYQRLLREFNLDFHPELILTREKRHRGFCNFDTQTVGISRYLFGNGLEDVLDTVRHEVAHIIAGYEAGHGPKWQEAAILVGAKPEACGKLMQDAKKVAKYLINCENCGTIGVRHKKTKVLTMLYKYRCNKCRGRLHVQENQVPWRS